MDGSGDYVNVPGSAGEDGIRDELVSFQPSHCVETRPAFSTHEVLSAGPWVTGYTLVATNVTTILPDFSFQLSAEMTTVRSFLMTAVPSKIRVSLTLP